MLHQVMKLRWFLWLGNQIETCLTETSNGDVEYFANWRGSFVPGLEKLGEREMIQLLKSMRRHGLICYYERVCAWNSSEYRVTWGF